MVNKLEVLCPAGDAERLEMALHYGADAVYLAGRQFGMRAAAGNFDGNGMRRAISLAHGRGAKVYITINTLPREGELALLPDYLERCADMEPDGFIIADVGVMALAKRYAGQVPLHVSTQLGVMNSAAACALHNMGAQRVVLAREMHLDEIAELRAKTPPELELEAFVHGAMCVSFSGRCLLSNYMNGRDANQGACAQPCRWKYHLVEERRPGEYFEITEDGGTHIMNSYDMCMVDHIPELAAAGITSLKIEGRMKSAYYAAITAYAYRGAVDDYYAGRPFDTLWLDECMKVSHRKYCTGFYFGEPRQHYADASYFADADVCAVVEEPLPDGTARLTQRNKLCEGDTLELVMPGERPVRFTAAGMKNAEGEPILSTPHAMMEFTMPLPVRAERLSILRRLKA